VNSQSDNLLRYILHEHTSIPAVHVAAFDLTQFRVDPEELARVRVDRKRADVVGVDAEQRTLSRPVNVGALDGRHATDVCPEYKTGKKNENKTYGSRVR